MHWLLSSTAFVLFLSTRCKTLDIWLVENLFNSFRHCFLVASMWLPHRAIKSIQPLPSIFTTFPINYDSILSSNDSRINSGTQLIGKIEDGIEVVPFEMCNTLSAPILRPDQAEKEVHIVLQLKINSLEKSLPSLPNLPSCIWQRLSPPQRIAALLVMQFLILLTIGLALLATKSHSSEK